MLHVCAFTVIPRSRSTSSLSRTCFFPPGSMVPVSSRSLSLSVLFPWSTWATMQKLRNRSSGISAILFSKLPTTFDAYRGEEDEKVLLKIGIWVGSLEPCRAFSIRWKHGRISHSDDLAFPPPPLILELDVVEDESCPKNSTCGEDPRLKLGTLMLLYQLKRAEIQTMNLLRSMPRTFRRSSSL